MSAFPQFHKELQHCMIADRNRLRSLFNAQKWDALKAELEKSKIQVRQRGKIVPAVSFDSGLPIIQRKDEIAKLLREHQVVVVCGETGSGKSTQLPKICLELGFGVHGTIGHTQPRRIAARSVAARIAEELKVPLGQAIGYKVRFAEEASQNTLVKLMTDGILLAESLSDKFFDQYEVIIIDEAHERSLNIDFLLGMMKRLLPKRRDLKLIITSATIDAKRFADHFGTVKGPAPVVEVSGRAYPIDIRYRPLAEAEPANGDDEIDEETHLLNAVDELARMDRGDILIFMPTERDIFETAKLLRHHKIPGDDSVRKTEILPLYARLTVAEQLKVFKPHKERRIVIATNVAESSLTVPGIRYVIDPGTARISRYSARSKMQRLPIEPVSRASADQRAGRCGRVGPGICIRLFSQEDFEGRDRYTTPEIQRTNLASVILQTKAMRLGAIESFPFLDPPRSPAIQDGYKTLFELGAIDSDQNLTDLGWKLSKLPVDPRIGRMILAADKEGCLREILILGAVLEIQDPRERPYDKQDKADAAHLQFLEPDSDFFGYLKIWDFYHGLKENLSQSKLRKACAQNFLSYNRMKEWSDIHVQLMQLVRETKLRLQPRKDDYDAIHRSILTGFLSGIANRTDRFDYTVAGGTGQGKFYIWPGSGLMKKPGSEGVSPESGWDTRAPVTDVSSASEKECGRDARAPKGRPLSPNWLVCAEKLETTRKYLRCVAKIDSDWIERLASHLITKAYFEPHWNRQTGYVHAYEKVSLFGLAIVPKRRVNYGPIEPQKARDIFIQNALVEEELDTKCDFFAYNRLMIEEAESLQDKLRKYGLLRPTWAKYDFYQERVPPEVYDRKTLEKWYKVASEAEKRTLYFELADLCVEKVDRKELENYPNTLTAFDGTEVPIEYNYLPGETDDGLTVVVPIEGLRQLEPTRLGWLVPGLLESKITAMLRALPKEVRRSLVPIPDTARSLVKELSFADGVLEEKLAAAVSRLAGQRIKPEDFNREQLPHELKMNIRVVEENGKTLAAGRELDELRKQLGVQASQTIAAVNDPRWNRENLTEWNFGDLPESIEIQRGKIAIKAFPMLVDCGKTVSLQLADSLDRANRATRLGLMRLFQLKNSRDLNTQVQWMPLRSAGVSPAKNTEIADLIAARAMELDDKPIPRNVHEFTERMKQAKTRLPLAVQDATRLLEPLLESLQAARLAIEQNKSAKTQWAWQDATAALAELTGTNFLTQTPWNWLKEYPRYFKAVAARFEKLKSGGEQQDRTATAELGRYWNMYVDRLQLHEAAGILDPELLLFRYMIEEYRVSLFAQKLGTAVKASPQRLDKQWEKTKK